MLNLDLSKLRIKDYSSLKAKLSKIAKKPVPDFVDYKEDFEALKNVLNKYKKYENLIIIGNGGSNTSFKAFHQALVPMTYDKRTFIVTTMEPDLLKDIKSFFPKWNTLIMPISKSGTTIGVLEALFAFKGYKVLPVTSPNTGALSVIAKKQGFDMIPHPPVGGRYSGVTASAYAPAMFFDINVEEIDDGAKDMYKKCSPGEHIDENPALQLAAALYLLEQKGYDEIFCPIYSSRLAGFQNLVVQLMHESVCKRGRGQTIFSADAPESQHHTNQRFFGGKKNVLGLFLTVENPDDKESKVKIPDAVKNIKIKDGKLREANNVPYAKAIYYEFLGTYRDAINKRIPVAEISLDKITPFSIGEFMAFWHYVAVYSSWLRDVNPFDQPQVESSKDISWKLRKEHKK
ncbi:hypothetical protein ACFL3V_06660 [Nanoarchaeota archaeon]